MILRLECCKGATILGKKNFALSYPLDAYLVDFGAAMTLPITPTPPWSMLSGAEMTHLDFNIFFGGGGEGVCCNYQCFTRKQLSPETGHGNVYVASCLGS